MMTHEEIENQPLPCYVDNSGHTVHRGGCGQCPSESTTEKVKHTSGPWTVHFNANAELSVFAGNEILAVTWEPESFGDEGRAQEITQANAALIAASPEMLRALERVWDSRHEPDKWSLEVSRALEKATGQAHPFMGARELRDIRHAKGE